MGIVFSLFSTHLAMSGEAELDTLKSIPNKKSPTMAVLRSALIPGWGQWHNGQKFKALLVFFGEVSLIANVVYFNQQVQKSQSESEKVFYEENRSRYSWWFFGIYLLNLLDAYVDAHLWDFDIGPDLSLSGTIPSYQKIMFHLTWAL